MSNFLGAPDLLKIPLTDGTLTPTVGTITTSSTANDNNQWCWDPDISKYVQWSGPQADRVIYSSLGIRILPDRVNRLESYNTPTTGNTGGLSVDGGTLSLVELDGAEVDAGLEDILQTHHHRFINNTGSDKTLAFAGNIDEAGRNCAFSIWYRLTGGNANFYLTGGDEYALVPSDEWKQFKAENITPALATDIANIDLTDGGTLDFVLQQLENPDNADQEGVGYSEPIIVEGAQAARSNSVFNFTGTTDFFPADGFTVYMEATPSSDYQSTRIDASYPDETVAVLFAADVSTSNYFRIHVNGSAEIMAAGVSTRMESFTHSHNRTFGIAIRNDDISGFETFSSGYGGMTEDEGNPFVPVPEAVRTVSARIGRSNFGHTLNYNGWIRNFCVYSKEPVRTRGDLMKATGYYDDVTKLVHQLGTPVYDPIVEGRMWALEPAEDVSVSFPQDRYRYLVYSDDYFDTFTRHVDLGDDSSTNAFLQVDLAGNFYYNIQKGDNIDSLYKIRRSDSSVYEVIPSNQREYSYNAASISGNELTVTGHGFQYSDPIWFEAADGGSLPSGLSADTDYWVGEVIDANTITIETKRRGATEFDADTDVSGEVLTARSHGLELDQPVTFATTLDSSLDPTVLPSGITEGDKYYVLEIVSANSIRISTTVGGSAVSLGTGGDGICEVNGRGKDLGSAGSGTQTVRTNFTASWPGWNWAPVTTSQVVTGWYVTTEDYNEDDDGGGNPDDVAPSGHFFYNSTDGGDTFTVVDRNDIFGGEGRHIHNSGCSPWDATKVWFSLSDLGSATEGRATGYIAASDLTGTFTDVSDPDYGPTGLSFSEEGAFFGTDITTDAEGNPNARNGLNYSDGVTTRRGWRAQGQFRGTHVYHLAMAGKNEAWMTGFSEGTNTSERECYTAKLVKEDGLNSPWRVAKWIPLHCRYTDGFNPYMIGRTAQGVIPEWSEYAFIYMQRVNLRKSLPYDIAPILNTSDGGAMYRVKRDAVAADFDGVEHPSGVYPLTSQLGLTFNVVDTDIVSSNADITVTDAGNNEGKLGIIVLSQRGGSDVTRVLSSISGSPTLLAGPLNNAGETSSEPRTYIYSVVGQASSTDYTADFGSAIYNGTMQLGFFNEDGVTISPDSYYDGVTDTVDTEHVAPALTHNYAQWMDLIILGYGTADASNLATETLGPFLYHVDDLYTTRWGQAIVSAEGIGAGTLPARTVTTEGDGDGTTLANIARLVVGFAPPLFLDNPPARNDALGVTIAEWSAATYLENAVSYEISNNPSNTSINESTGAINGTPDEDQYLLTTITGIGITGLRTRISFVWRTGNPTGPLIGAGSSTKSIIRKSIIGNRL